MSTKIIHRAPWTSTQVLSAVVPIVLALISWVMWFVGLATFEWAIAGTIIFGGLGLFFGVANWRLKKRSQLTAVLAEDDDYNIDVFQLRPRAYWNDQMNYGKNRMSLFNVNRVRFGNNHGIVYVLFDNATPEGYVKTLRVPVRLLKQDAVRKYFAAAFTAGEVTPSFVKPEQEDRLAAIIATGEDPGGYEDVRN